ncbi:MAG: Holliday junction branch migration protein RuvA [Thermodesulfobacteriota bacterium]
MIAQIRGQLIEKNPGSIIIETNGVGFQVFISLHTFYDLPEIDQPVRIYTYTHVREDALQLYGFSTLLERELFQILLSVSGIGPKLALNILSGISASVLLKSLSMGDSNRLLSIPGVGRKMAERMILDLREKVAKLELRPALLPSRNRVPDQISEDVVSALINLGYKKNEAEQAVKKVLAGKEEKKLEEVLKDSLQILSKGRQL